MLTSFHSFGWAHTHWFSSGVIQTFNGICLNFGSLCSRNLSGIIASEKCSSCQLVDLKMNEVWFGVHRLKSGVSQTKPPAGSDLPVRSWVKIPISPTACGLWWKVYFHPDLPGSHKNSPIFTTATPPRSHNQNLFCVGSDGYIRAQCGSAHPSTHGYMILATSNPHSSPRVQTNLCKQPNPHKSLQNLENHNVYSESNISWIYLVTEPKIRLVVNAPHWQWHLPCTEWNSCPEYWIFPMKDSNTTPSGEYVSKNEMITINVLNYEYIRRMIQIPLTWWMSLNSNIIQYFVLW